MIKLHYRKFIVDYLLFTVPIRIRVHDKIKKGVKTKRVT